MQRLLPTLCLATFWALAVGWAPVDEDDDLVREFKVYYDDDRSPRERFEAVKVLEDVGSVAATRALLEAFEDEDFNVRRAAIEVVGGYGREDVARVLVDEVLLEKKTARKKLLRAGAAEAAGMLGFDFAREPLLEMLESKEIEWQLAAMAGLGALADPAACPALSAFPAGNDGALAVGALRALVAIGASEPAEDAVLGALQHDDWRVRAEAVQAVVQLRIKAGIRGLIERMRVEEGRLRGDAYEAVKELTMRSFRDDPDIWLTWWDRTEDDFTLPDPEKLAEARKRLAEEGTSYTFGSKSFLGVETTSENLLFVIDVSGSMETTFGNPERLAASGRDYTSLQRLEIVKEELTNTVAGLPDTTSFNILAFARDVKAWKKGAARANVLNKNNASGWIGKLKPLGGMADSFRARTGLSDDQANEGGTNTYLALMSALGEEVDDKKRRGPAQYVTKPGKDPVDTIYFLTDGDPTVGKTVDMNEIRAEVQRVNSYRGIEIHVIYVGALGGQDFKALAEENGGVFVSLGG